MVCGMTVVRPGILIPSNIPNDEIGVVVAQVMEYDGNGPAVLILEIDVLVSWAAVSPRKMAVVPRSQPELWWQFFFNANVAAGVRVS